MSPYLVQLFATGTGMSTQMKSVDIVVYVLIALLMVAATWKIFSKAKQPGWTAIIPVYSTVVLLRVVRRPWWWTIWYIIPVINVVVHYIVSRRLSRAFGKGGGYTFLLFWLPFIGFPMLGFGEAKYKG
jgi:hypothetical protein